jgi:hypothetical protein
MSDFILYIKQRFNLGIFSLLTVFLLLFSKNKLIFDWEDVTHFFMLFFFLFVMRLFDDLQNSITDSHKKNRIYTDRKARKNLSVILALLLIPFLYFVYLFKTELLNYVIAFFLINWLLYLLLFPVRNFKSYLPLLKYPLVCIAFLGEFNWACVALFLAMIVFEILEDAQFPIERKYAYPLAILAMSLLIPSMHLYYFLLLLVMLSLTLFLITRKTKWTPYQFLLLFLLTRLITISYEI